MATRALIGYLDSNKVLTTTYNHYDGYPDYLGKKLKEFYNTDDLAIKIANTGYISSIEEDGTITSKYDEIADKIQLDDDIEEAGLTVAAEINGITAEYGYIWFGYDWFTIKNNGIEGMAAQFDDEMSSSGMFIVDENKKEDIMEEGYEAKWAKFLNESQEVDFDVIKKYIQDDTQRGDEEDPAMDAYISSLKRDFKSGGERSSTYDDYEMDDYVEDFQNYIADKMDS